MNDLIQSLMTNWLSDAIKVGVMAAITCGLTWLNLKYPSWGSHARYALTIFALLTVLLFTFTGRAILSVEQPQTTTDNVEQRVRLWLDDLNIPFSKLDDPQAYFHFVVTDRLKQQIGIWHPKKRDRYIIVDSNLTFTKESDQIRKLKSEDKDEIGEQTRLDMVRNNVSLTLNLDTIPPAMYVEKEISINNDFTEDVLQSTLRTIGDSLLAAEDRVDIQMRHASEKQSNSRH